MNIIPAILENDFKGVQEKLTFLINIKKKYALNFNLVQIDICDGVFVESKTWIPSGRSTLEIDFINSCKNYFDIEYHLMSSDIKDRFLELLSINPKLVVVHVDDILFSLDLKIIIAEASRNFIKLSICAKIDFLETYKEEIIHFLEENPKIDLQIMGINNIGIQGQEFEKRAIDLIRGFKSNFQDTIYIQLDGGVNNENISNINRVGADAVVVGSYLIKELDESKFISNFKSLA